MDYVHRFRFTYTDNGVGQERIILGTWTDATLVQMELTLKGYENIALGIM